ncbi:transcriptional regulator containing PAS, AAA-type ATPase, and DNA-binding domains [Desulfosporosinus orientis DSM 765]|uniref:Transcriptional regulator containing PAS, AAA-type ATPase, and DNA-binding domains n=1 Tax=Desulfosporosinus orientis (strain ATCC 19365 / DSM 765 / NCIMB 8382 / VKM B-1628 / Singapore I) TaxID=768706 RepID=G7WGQ6_DESOD|nr:sigma-54-dependent Fis family transcriptional regulator [Desulfosporosinus orientis]AET68492.1 transcriptional regulator containing PAS, AAA-type ATPase, and DNA-binding domains [Desulfosporosinus orientis DSM 765]
MAVNEKLAYIARAQLPVKELMNRSFQVIRPEDNLRKVLEICLETKLDTLPVVDENDRMIGVLPKGRLYDALLESQGLDEPCASYVIYYPIEHSMENAYINQAAMIERSYKRRAGNVPVLNSGGKVVGIIGKVEYLRETLALTIESYVLLESVFQTIYEGMIVVDNEGTISRINQSAQKMFCLQEDKALNTKIQDLIPEVEFIPGFNLGVKRTIRSVPVIMNQVPIQEEGKQIGYNLAFLDLSNIEDIAQELEIVKELKNTVTGVLRASSDGVFISGRNGVIIYVNEKACNLLGVSSDKLIGLSLASVFHNDLPLQAARTGIAEVDICRFDGKNCLIHHLPVKDKEDEFGPVRIFTTIYLADKKLTEDIARTWLSLRQQVQYYREALLKKGMEKSGFESIVSNNPEVIKITLEAQQIARSSSTVLLVGESGVGKDLFARAIHLASPRADQIFVKINCAAIPETLLESELFGYAPGSFTGASKKGKPGYFEQADLGTIFLDEIGEMPLSIQVKILQVIQEKQFMRIGGTTQQKVDVRIIAATNRDLKEAIAKGTFREDLYYRLNVIEFTLPPLRSRPEDILPLAEFFVQKNNRTLGTSIIGIDRASQAALTNYSWPGNIRELENAIERAANYAWEGEIGVEHLPPHILQNENIQIVQEPSSFRTSLDNTDKNIIIDALKKAEGNKSAAAKILKISRSSFYRRMAKYNLC